MRIVNSGFQLCFYILICLNLACSVKYIGPNNRYVCNCENDQCLTNGNCRSGYGCKRGFIGYACQYNNILDNTSFTIAELADNSFDTCVSLNTSVYIHFNSTRVLFVRLVVKDDTKVRGIKFNFKDKNLQATCNGTFYVAQSNTIEYHCRQPGKTNGVNISHINDIPVCHIGITDGRDLALKSRVSVASSFRSDNYSPQGLTDGIHTLSNGTCFLGDDSINVFINFTEPLLPNVFEFIGIPDKEIDDDLVPVTVKLWDANSNQERSFKIQHSSWNGGKYISDDPHRRISRIALVGQQTFGACEVRLLGDCPIGTYGLSCADKCPDECRRCNIEGDCLDDNKPDCHHNCAGFGACYANRTCRYGCTAYNTRPTCDTMCSTHCGQLGMCHPNGTCTDGCKSKYFGPSCDFKCSSNCAQDGTCYENGTCRHGCLLDYFGPTCNDECSPICTNGCFSKVSCTYGCVPGFYGADCTLKCSSNCAQDGSCYENGTCRHGCLSNYNGPSCEDECSPFCTSGCLSNFSCISGCVPGYYGADCTLKCSPFCTSGCLSNVSCTTGCVPGYYGADCTLICSSHCGGMNNECYSNGSCKFGCDTGFYGADCASECSSSCVGECYSNGTCMSGCDPGFYGANCKLRCSPQCAKNKECYSNGICTFGCIAGFIGDKCTKRCSPYCGNDGSCGEDGRCIHDCQPGYYGPHCTHLGLSSYFSENLTWTCHCPGDKCKDVFGVCDLYDYCIYGHFGYYCDYRDLATLATKIDPILNDYDNTTCHDFKNRTVTVEWAAPFYFSWMSLNFEENASVSNFVVIVQEGNDSRIIKEDSGLLKIRTLWPNLYELKVMHGSFLTILDIIWSGKGALCSLHISGGHNLALGLRMLSHTKEHRHRRLQMLPITDGDVGGDNCVDLSSEFYQDFEIHFEKSVWINYIHIYPDIRKPANASVSFLLKTNTLIEAVHVHIVGVKVSKWRIDFNQTVKSIVILLVEGKLHLCEIEIIGECTPPNYGFNCREICSITCSRERCDYGGQCLQCPEGRSGPYCMIMLGSRESSRKSEALDKPPAVFTKSIATRFSSSLYVEFVLIILSAKLMF